MKSFLVALLCLLALASTAVAQTKSSTEAPSKPVLWILPHTHWEGAVFKSREDYLTMGLPHILTALRLLKAYPDYRFTLDQVDYYRPFLERYPEEASDFRKFVAEGRLQIVGGTEIMPDDNMPSGESFVRQMLYGKRYTREALGIDVKTSWMLDTFGHNAQIPQLLRLAGFDSFWYFRGVEDDQTAPVQSLWQGLDGSVIRAVKPPFVFYDPPKELAKFTDFMEKRYASLAPFSRGATNRIDLEGLDVSDPELYVPELVEKFNRQPNMPILLRYGTPEEFEAAVANQPDLPMFKGERNPIYQGVYSSRIELKERMRETERLLTTAEKFGAMASLFGRHDDSQAIEKAWEPALFNVTHDLASGVMSDYVYDDTVRSYDFCQRLARELIDAQIGSIAQEVNTRGEGAALTVFNTLGWARTDVAVGNTGFDDGGITDFEVVDSKGKSVPSQIVEIGKYADGGLRNVTFAFVARNVPSMGFAVYHVIPRKEKESLKAAVKVEGSTVIENSFYRADFDSKGGALTSLRIKQGDWDALSGAANVVAEDLDNGDFWELNHNLNGSQSDMMKTPVNAPERGVAKFSDEFSGAPAVITRGPVFSEFQIKHGFGKNTFATDVRIYNDMPRIDFTTRILNNDEHVRYRVLFPTTIKNGRNFQEIPFGAIERPQNMELPAQNWMDYSDGQHGIALLNRGLPGNNVANNTLVLSLLRSVRIQAYNDVGGFEGQSSDSGLELGKEFTLQYALLPHSGDWRHSEVYREGLEFNNPFIVEKVAPHPGKLGAEWGLMEVSPANVVVSAVKLSTNHATIVRVYEANGESVNGATILLHGQVLAASESTLLENTGAPLPVKQNTIRFDLRPFEIKTFSFRLAAP
jgi:alpha-mannosidase